MNIDNLLDSLKSDHKLGEQEIQNSIEILIRSILFEDIKKKSIRYERDYKISEIAKYDIYLLDKYEIYTPPIVIEFAPYIDSNYLDALLHHLFFNNNINFKTLLIIHLNDFKPKTSIFEEAKKIGVDLKFLNKSFINKVISRNKPFTEKTIKNLFSIKIQETVFNKEEDWKLHRLKLISSLSKIYKESKKTSLLIGAGVSCSANLPSWNELISGLFITYLINTNHENNELNDMKLNDFITSIREINKNFSEKYLKSALLSARYLRKGLASDDKDNSNDFIELLRENLYKNNKPRESKLIEVISQLCLPSRTGAKIHSIINYNFDDLLEQHFEKNNLKYKSIYYQNATYTNEELPIYHVHGFIPEKSTSYNNLDLIEMVFSEEGYHRMYSNPYHWSNLVQLANLRDNTCVMIGLSMDDPNLRRLLDISQNGNPNTNHYAFLKRVSLNEISSKKENESTMVEESFLKRHHNLQELIFKELGVNVIWFEEFEELPELLNQLLN